MTDFARLLGIEDLAKAPQTEDVPKALGGNDIAAKIGQKWQKLGSTLSYSIAREEDEIDARLVGGSASYIGGLRSTTISAAVLDAKFNVIQDIFYSRKQTDFAIFAGGQPYRATGMIRNVGDVTISNGTMEPVDIEIILTGKIAVGKTLEQRALDFATEAHSGQVRKYDGRPYIYHPIAVAEIVRGFPHSEAMIAAALLHDVVEDTSATIKDIQDEFGDEVTALVAWLTDVSRPEDGNRAARKAKDRDHLALAPADAQTIKLADLIDNSASIARHDPDFWKIFRHEKLALLEVLKRGNAMLWKIAREQIEDLS